MINFVLGCLAGFAICFLCEFIKYKFTEQATLKRQMVDRINYLSKQVKELKP